MFSETAEQQCLGRTISYARAGAPSCEKREIPERSRAMGWKCAEKLVCDKQVMSSSFCSVSLHARPITKVSRCGICGSGLAKCEIGTVVCMHSCDPAQSSDA